ncbi:MAG TPA: transposase [Myxococcota bacterium]
MSLSHVSGTLAAILGAFSGQFGRPTFRTFVSLVVGWLLCSGRHTVSRAIVAARSAGASGHHARFYRFFASSAWRQGTDALGRIVWEMLLPLLPSPIELIVDDTLCRKGGPQIFGAAMHHDAVASSYGGAAGPRRVLSFGHDWVVLSVRVPVPWSVGRAIAVPLLARLYRGKKRTPPAQYRKRTQLGREMLDRVLEWLPQDRRVRLLGDSEYACRTLVRTLPQRVAFVGPVVMKAALCELAPPYSGRGRPAARGRRLPSPQLMRRAPQSAWTPIEAVLYGRRVKLLVQSVVCLWWTVAGERAVRVVLARDPAGRYRDRAFFATDPTLSAAEILALFSHRWDLEVTFRDLKQLLGLADPQNGWWRRPAAERPRRRCPGPRRQRARSRNAVLRTVPFVLAVHGIVVVWYLRHGQVARDVAAARLLTPWRTRKRAPCFADMLAALRADILRRRLSAHPLPERVQQKVLRLVLPLCGAAA